MTMMQIMMSYGGKPGAKITEQSVYAFANEPDTATAAYELTNDGVAQTGVNWSYTPITDEWLLTGAAGDYECRCTVDSGTLTSGTTGTWLALSTTRGWYLDLGSPGITNCIITVEIRPNGGAAITSAQITLEAEIEL